MTFNPNQHLSKIKTKEGYADYLAVQWRLVWFRENFPNGSIETEVVLIDLDREYSEKFWSKDQQTGKSSLQTRTGPGIAIFRATVKDGQGGIGVGTKSEKAVSFGDFIEKAETGAIGRALASLGFGTQFTGEELRESLVERYS